MERIVIRAMERPDFKEPDKLLKWFVMAFGLATNDESAGVEEEILNNFAKAAFNNQGLSSSDLKLHTKMARSTVIYHLNRLIESGLVVKRGRKYYLRASEMSKAIEEIAYDINREFSRMLDTAREFDRLMFSEMRGVSGSKPIALKGKNRK